MPEYVTEADREKFRTFIWDKSEWIVMPDGVTRCPVTGARIMNREVAERRPLPGGDHEKI